MIKNRAELQACQTEYKSWLDQEQKQVLVCAGTGCVACGSLEIYAKISQILTEKGSTVNVKLQKESGDCMVSLKASGCHGFCEVGPLIRIEPQGILYIKAKLEDCQEIVEKTILGDQIIERLVYKQNGIAYAAEEEIPFYAQQNRLVLENCGHTNVECLEEYLARDGYSSVAKTIYTMSQKEVVDEMIASNLRGRGGGGFPAGLKWEQALIKDNPTKYIICNGDEGDPGAFMDRSIMEGDPHRLLEGMIIAAYAIGAEQGYIYVRAEYPLAITRLEIAIKQAKEMGLLGKNILGTNFNFDIAISQGAGAFVCGEETALIESLEGNRGMPRIKPPRAVEKGLFGKPTIINNVETFATVPMIITKGAAWFCSIGTAKSPGTKAFALTGNVQNTGLIEVPMGTTLRHIIYEVGGGIRGNKQFKAVQIGGPSGGCLTAEHLDLPLDFDSLKEIGAMIGSGGLVVMDEDTCIVEVARFFMNFTQNESCGKCVPCREGTKRMLEILERIVAGNGELKDLAMLEELADTISQTALCGLGKTAPSPVVSSLKYFKDEYLAHIIDKKCPAGECQALKNYHIIEDLCKGCTKCAKICPVNAISGTVKNPFIIDNQKCIKCGACLDSCKFKAIICQ